MSRRRRLRPITQSLMVWWSDQIIPWSRCYQYWWKGTSLTGMIIFPIFWWLIKLQYTKAQNAHQTCWCWIGKLTYLLTWCVVVPLRHWVSSRICRMGETGNAACRWSWVGSSYVREPQNHSLTPLSVGWCMKPQGLVSRRMLVLFIQRR